MNRKFNSRQWWEFLIVDQAARQHQPSVPAPDDGPAGGDGYGHGEVLAQVCGASSALARIFGGTDSLLPAPDPESVQVPPGNQCEKKTLQSEGEMLEPRQIFGEVFLKSERDMLESSRLPVVLFGRFCLVGFVW